MPRSRRTNLLVEWTGDLEVRSINMSIDVPLAKDYDAIADLEFEGARYRIAIEYERSLKSSKRYHEIISAIAKRAPDPPGPLPDVIRRSSVPTESGIRRARPSRLFSRCPMCFVKIRWLPALSRRRN